MTSTIEDIKDVSRETASGQSPLTSGCKNGHPAGKMRIDKRGRRYCSQCTSERLTGRKMGGARAAGKPQPRPKGQPDYRPGLNGLVQLASMPLVMVGMAKPVFLADAAAITQHGPPIVEAVNDLAHEDPRLAAVLDRVLSMGPYGALIAAVLPLGAQVLANHKLIPAGVARALGATDPDALITNLVHEMGEQARHAEEETAYVAASSSNGQAG